LYHAPVEACITWHPKKITSNFTLSLLECDLPDTIVVECSRPSIEEESRDQHELSTLPTSDWDLSKICSISVMDWIHLHLDIRFTALNPLLTISATSHSEVLVEENHQQPTLGSLVINVTDHSLVNLRHAVFGKVDVAVSEDSVLSYVIATKSLVMNQTPVGSVEGVRAAGDDTSITPRTFADQARRES